MINKLFCFVILLFLPLIIVSSPIITAQDSATDSSVYIIPVHGEINRSLTVFIRRGIQEARSQGVDWIVFDVNTFGGLVESALQIATLIGSEEQIETIAYIPANPETTGVSWSAGALISFACDRIYMAPGTSIGSAAPVYMGLEGVEMAQEKTVSAVRTQMAALAEKNGYPKSIALAMVDMDVELYEVRIDDKTVLVTADELEHTEKEAEKNGYTFENIRIVSRKGKLLALTAGEMEKYGLSSGTSASIEELLGFLGISGVIPVEHKNTLADRMEAALTGGAVTAVLIMIGLGALYLEITTPGFGIPGTVAIIAFAVLFAANSMLGQVGSLEILMFLVGVILLIIEVFLIPGFGAAGISGILLISLSMLISRQDFIFPEFEWQWEIVERNFIVTGIGLIGSIILAGIFFRFFGKLPLFNRLILESGEESENDDDLQLGSIDRNLLGLSGIAVTCLRPAGKAEFNNRILVVESDGNFIEKGDRVVIYRIDGNRIVVREG